MQVFLRANLSRAKLFSAFLEIEHLVLKLSVFYLFNRWEVTENKHCYSIKPCHRPASPQELVSGALDAENNSGQPSPDGHSQHDNCFPVQRPHLIIADTN